VRKRKRTHPQIKKMNADEEQNGRLPAETAGFLPGLSSVFIIFICG
jgi:hypothetical protein